jgi:hypothetical protein
MVFIRKSIEGPALTEDWICLGSSAFFSFALTEETNPSIAKIMHSKTKIPVRLSMVIIFLLFLSLFDSSSFPKICTTE